MRIFVLAAALALIGFTAAPVFAGPGCSGYKSAKVSYPATALEPTAPQTPVPATGDGG
ncbi:MAG TPA: hypothetical protein VED46_13845 [Alphaproteobacteria bacterium]|nr:hypothetical protein [Alphaproteobacteria bacterium]